MTEADALLDQLWAADQAPVRDPSFRLAVIDRLARRRLRRDLSTYATVAAGLGAAAWGVAPIFADLGDVLTGTIAVAALATLGFALSLVPTLPAAFSRG